MHKIRIGDDKMYYLVPYFICMFYQISYFKRQKLLKGAPTFVIMSMPIVTICYTSLYLGRFSFLLQYMISLSVMAILLLVITHLIYFKRNVLSHIHTRYFYISSILIYLYVFTSLNGKNVGTSAGMPPLLAAVFMLTMSLLMLIILNLISEKEKIPIVWKSLFSWKLWFATLGANLCIFFFTAGTIPFIDSRITMIVFGLPVLLPYIYRMYDAMKQSHYQTIFSTGFGIMILLFFLLAMIELTEAKIPLLYYYDIFTHRGIQLGLYGTVLLLLPSMKKLPYACLYHMLAIGITLLCLLLFF